VLSRSPGSRIWLAEREGVLAGCIAIVAVSAQEAQLRWFVVGPEARGIGLGKRLLDEAIGFCREFGYDSVMLWTVSVLEVAAHLYRAAGFVKVEEHPVHRWGVDVVEEKYSMAISRRDDGFPRAYDPTGMS
jgi:N-acetylglutamate synthase-like GNAT family acetyltransferase